MGLDLLVRWAFVALLNAHMHYESVRAFMHAMFKEQFGVQPGD
jgi:hypothetical protein